MAKVVKYDVGTGYVTEYLPKANTPDYLDGNGDPLTGHLVDGHPSSLDFSAVDGLPLEHWKVVGGALTDALDMDNYKDRVMSLADGETGRRIELGFTHDDHNSPFSTLSFSLSDGAQLSYLEAHASSATWLPYDWPEMGDSGYSISFAGGETAELEALCEAAFAKIRQRRLAGEAARAAIRGAADKAAADQALQDYLDSPE